MLLQFVYQRQELLNLEVPPVRYVAPGVIGAQCLSKVAEVFWKTIAWVLENQSRDSMV